MRATSRIALRGKPARDEFARTTPIFIIQKANSNRTFPDSVGRVVAMRTASHRLSIVPQDINELYDLQSDPSEIRNCYKDSAHHGVRQQLESRLLNWLVQTSDVTPFAVDARGFPGA